MILAFSLQSEINKIGAYAGFAAIIGLALLVLLYFAQARELRRLSDWVEQEGDRVRSVPASPRPTVIPQAGVAPPPASAVTTAVPGVRRVAVGAAGAVPAASAAAATASATAAAPPLAPATPAAPLTPATAGSPLAPATAAGADATRVAAPKSEPPLVPEEDAKLADGAAPPADGAAGAATPARAGAMPWGAAAVPLAAAPAATAEPGGSVQQADAGVTGTKEPQDEYAPDTAETAAAAALLPSAAAVVSVPPVVGVPAEPSKAEPATSKVTPLRSAGAPAAASEIPAKPADAAAPATPPATDDPPPLAPSTAAGARPRFPPAPEVRAAPVGAAARVSGRSGDAAKLEAGVTAPTRRRERERERERERPPADDDDRPPGLGTPTLRLIVAAVVIVAVLIFVASRVLGGGSSTPPGSQTTSSQSSGVSGPSPSTVRVAVLNGTHTTGLATSVSSTLVTKGFRKGAIADAPDQTHTSTIVGYTPGNRAAAVEVAADLSLSSSQVQPADSASTAVADTHHARSKVIVTLGSDFSQQ
jgi:hypothetical protein